MIIGSTKLNFQLVGCFIPNCHSWFHLKKGQFSISFACSMSNWKFFYCFTQKKILFSKINSPWIRGIFLFVHKAIQTSSDGNFFGCYLQEEKKLKQWNLWNTQFFWWYFSLFLPFSMLLVQSCDVFVWRVCVNVKIKKKKSLFSFWNSANVNVYKNIVAMALRFSIGNGDAVTLAHGQTETNRCEHFSYACATQFRTQKKNCTICDIILPFCWFKRSDIGGSRHVCYH